MCGIGIMHVIIATTMSEQEVNFVEGGDVRYRGCHVAWGVDLREVHVPFSVNGIWRSGQHGRRSKMWDMHTVKSPTGNGLESGKHLVSHVRGVCNAYSNCHGKRVDSSISFYNLRAHETSIRLVTPYEQLFSRLMQENIPSPKFQYVWDQHTP